MAEDAPRQFLGQVSIDQVSLAPASPQQEHERKVAITDLLRANVFAPEDGPGGPYDLAIGMVEERLVLDITGAGYERRHILSLSPFRRIVRDYMTLCRSYNEAVSAATPSQIEAIDMGRRGLHNEGSDLLRERLAGKAATDLATARRLFTLLCALHWRG